MTFTRIGRVARSVAAGWRRHRIPSRAAALAFYALFAAAPLLLIAVAVAGFALGRAAAEGELLTRIEGLVGRSAAETLQGVLRHMARPRAGLAASAAGLALLLLASLLAGSFASAGLLFAAVYRVLPETPVRWRDAAAGGLAAAALFTLGRYAIAFYLARSTLASAYGAAGSLVAILVWVYYSTQIFLLGAEVARACGTTARRKRRADLKRAVA